MLESLLSCHTTGAPMVLRGLKSFVNIVVGRLKNSKTEQHDLSNYVQMDEKTTKNAKIVKGTHSLSKYL